MVNFKQEELIERLMDEIRTLYPEVDLINVIEGPEDPETLWIEVTAPDVVRRGFMDPITIFPNTQIESAGPMSHRFLEMGAATFAEACRRVHEMPYGYNSDREDPMILFKEGKGTCTTKHRVIGELAGELGIPVEKHIGIYAMTEAVVAGTDPILEKYGLPYIPMIHCFLVYGGYRVDLTEGNRNGKNRPIDDFLHTEPVAHNISGKAEYLKYRQALQDHILGRAELRRADMKTLLHAREEGLAVLKSNVGASSGPGSG
jgi:hypothetical protein